MAEEPKKITNYPSNSHREREQKVAEKREPVEKIEGLVVTQRKKTLGRKIMENFSGDDAESVGQHVLFEVLLPAAKDMLFDAIKEAAQRALYSGGGKPGRNSSRSNYNHTSYDKMYGSVGGSTINRNSPPVRTISKQARANHDFREIILGSRGEAQEVLDRLDNLISKYGTASVADLYSTLGITGAFTDDKFGWTNLAGADVRHTRDGYLLILPDTLELD